LTTRIIDADLKADLTTFEQVIQMVVQLKGAWEGIASSTRENLPQEAEAVFASRKDDLGVAA
jgi:flagellin-specific chaperone FliS